MAILKEEIGRRLIELIVNGEFKESGQLPTMRELANDFGASVATIQKVINDLKKDGYVTAIHGKRIDINRRHPKLMQKGDMRVALVSFYDEKKIKREGYPRQAIEPMEKLLAKRSVAFSYFNLSDYNEIVLMDKLRNSDLVGIALLEINDGHLIGEMKKLRLPMVSMDYSAYSEGVSSVVFSNAWGAFYATRHLIENGHRLITAINPSYRRRFGNSQFEDSVQQDRMLGYTISMKNASLEPKIVEAGIEEHEIEKVILSTFASRPCPTALYIHQNLQARLIVAKLTELGFKIPQDISIISFDAEKISSDPKLRIASIKVDSREMGLQAGELLLSQIFGKDHTPRKIIVETSFVPGNSVAKI